ncbi:MAG TPA: transketolase [Methylomirabilota bacterium]|nr:transketolase [Methylomirabilota bacterium]
MTESERGELTRRAREIRETTLRAIHAVQTGHAGSSLSMVELLTILYFRHLRYDVRNPRWPERDHFLLSKGHGAPGLYATLAHAGFFPLDEMLTLRRLGSRLQGHPNANDLPGLDASLGSLGQGLSVAVGLALGFKLQGRANRVYCLLGDGELQEGQNWEAMMAAAGLGLGALVAIVDRNGLQNDGDTEQIVPLGDLAAKARAFGWRTWTVDGHDFEALDRALAEAVAPAPAPAMLIARTVKGKGVSYMEGVVKWHHHPINDAELAHAMRDLREGHQGWS